MEDRYPDDPEDRAALARAAQGGLCGVCRHARLVRNPRGSVFARCTHPDLPKYPPQPVLRCAAFAEVGS
jgi:hypothetical protein